MFDPRFARFVCFVHNHVSACFKRFLKRLQDRLATSNCCAKPNKEIRYRVTATDSRHDDTTATGKPSTAKPKAITTTTATPSTAKPKATSLSGEIRDSEGFEMQQPRGADADEDGGPSNANIGDVSDESASLNEAPTRPSSLGTAPEEQTQAPAQADEASHLDDTTTGDPHRLGVTVVAATVSCALTIYLFILPIYCANLSLGHCVVCGVMGFHARGGLCAHITAPNCFALFSLR